MQWERFNIMSSPKMKGTAEFNSKYSSRSPTLSTEEDRRKAKQLKQRLDCAQVRLKNLESDQTHMKRLMKTLQTSFDEFEDSTLMETEEERKKTIVNTSSDIEQLIKGTCLTTSPSVERKQEKLSDIFLKMKIIRKKAPHCDKNKILSTISQKISRSQQKYYDYIKENNTFLLKMLIYNLYQEIENMLLDQTCRSPYGNDYDKKLEKLEETIVEKDLIIARVFEEKNVIVDFIKDCTGSLEEWVKVLRECQKKLKPEKNEFKNTGLEERVIRCIKEVEKLQETSFLLTNKFQEETLLSNSDLGTLSQKHDFLSCNTVLDIFHLKSEIAKDEDLSIIEDPKNRRIQDLENECAQLKSLIGDKKISGKDESKLRDALKRVKEENFNLKEMLALDRSEISRLSGELLSNSTFKDAQIKQLNKENEVLKESASKAERMLACLERDKDGKIKEMEQEINIVRDQLFLCKTEKNYLEKDHKNIYSSSVGVRVRELTIRVHELEQREHQLIKEKENIAEALKAEHDQNLVLSKQLEETQRNLKESLEKHQEMQDDFVSFKTKTERLSSNIEALEVKEKVGYSKEINLQLENLIIQELSMIILSKTGTKSLDEKYKAILRDTYGEKMAHILEKYCERVRDAEEEKAECLKEIKKCYKRQERAFEIAKFFIQFVDQVIDFFSKLKETELKEPILTYRKEIEKKKPFLTEKKRIFSEEMYEWSKELRKINESEQSFHGVVENSGSKQKSMQNVPTYLENDYLEFILCQASSIENLLISQEKMEILTEKSSQHQQRDIDNIEEECTDENEDDEDDKIVSQASNIFLSGKGDQNKQFEDLMVFLKNKHKISE